MPGSPLPTPPDRESPFPQPRFPAGVSGGPLALLAVALAGAVALVADPLLAGTLVAVALVGHTLLWAGVVRPVHRLRAAMDEELRRATRVADAGPAPSTRSQVGEVDRVLTGVRRFTGGTVPGPAGRRVPIAAAPAAVAVLLLAWGCAAGAVTLGVDTAPAPDVARQAGVAAAERADRLHTALSAGLEALEQAAEPPTGEVVTDPATTAARVLAADGRFRAVSIVDDTGRTVVAAGHPAHPGPVAVPAGSRVVQANDGGSEPIVLATTPMWDGATSLVAEFDPRALNDVVRDPGVRTRVVDPHLDIVLDTGGYLAFSQLEDRAPAAAARGAFEGAAVVSLADDGRVVVAQRLAAPGSPTDPGWVLVEDRSVATAAFTADAGRRAALVVVALVTSIGLAALLWVGVTAVQPAGRLARHVERLAAGDAVEPLAPQRLDEIGTAVAATNRIAATRAVRDAVGRS